MRIRIVTERNVTEECYAEVLDIKDLENQIKNGTLWSHTTKPEEISGEVLFSTYYDTEDDSETPLIDESVAEDA